MAPFYHPRAPGPPRLRIVGLPLRRGLGRSCFCDSADAAGRPMSPCMLLCKSCNTRFEDGRSACPSCGRRIFVRLKEAPKPSEPSRAARRAVGTSRLRARRSPNELSGRDLDLGEVDVLAEAGAARGGRRAQARGAGEAAHARAPARARARAGRVPSLRGAGAHARGRSSPRCSSPTSRSTATRSRASVGVDLRTPVGSIDLLARDARRRLVVVAVPDPRDVESLMRRDARADRLRAEALRDRQAGRCAGSS